MIDFDVETDGLQAYSGNQPFLYTFSRGDIEDGELFIDFLFPSAFWERPGFDLASYLGTPLEADLHRLDDELIQWWFDSVADDPDGIRAWNSKFDRAMAEQQGFILPPDGKWHDGMVESKLMDERYSAALKVRGDRILGRTADPQKAVAAWLAEETKRRTKARKDALYTWLEDVKGLPQKRNRLPQYPPGLELPAELAELVLPNFSDVPWEIMYPYAIEDIVLTRGLGDWYADKIPPRIREVYALEMRNLDAFYAMEKRGLPVNREAAEIMLEDSSHRLSDALAHCRTVVGLPHFNPGSTQQVKTALEFHGVKTDHLPRNKPTTDRKTGKQKPGTVKLDAESLEALGHPIAQAVLAFRGEETAMTRYFHPMLRVHKTPRGSQQPFLARDGRVHTTYLQVGAKTGRTSSMDPNIQNWPRDDLRLRYLVEAPPGKVLLSADMDSIEARVAAVYAGPGAWRDKVLEGRIHEHTAKMTNLGDRQRAIGFESSRQRGKKMNYLILYSGGVRALRQWFGFSQGEAKTKLDAFHAAYPELRQLSDSIQWRLADRGYIETMLGRRIRIEKSVREEGYKFVNYLIQGTAADMIKIAIDRCHREGIELIGMFHDELLAIADPDKAEEQLAFMERALSDFSEWITEPVEFKAEGAIVGRWSDAKDPDYVPDALQKVTA